MRIKLTLLTSALAVFWLMPPPAEAQQERGARAKVKQAKTYRRPEPRAASVGRNGLCQRDTGTSDSALNFRNRCDVEEFWTRMMERGTDSSW